MFRTCNKYLFSICFISLASPGVCANNETFVDCTDIKCYQTCDDVNNRPTCPTIENECSKPGCICIDGYVKDQNGICIDADDCRKYIMESRSNYQTNLFTLDKLLLNRNVYEFQLSPTNQYVHKTSGIHFVTSQSVTKLARMYRGNQNVQK